MTRPGTLGELRASGWVSRPVKEEVRANAIARIAEGKPLVDGVIGYEDTVLPQLENALHRRPRRDLPRRARPGEDPHDPLAHRAARRVDADRRGQRDQRRPVRPDLARTPACSSPSAATTRRSSGCTATAASARSSPRPTRRSPTSSARSTRSRSPRAATSPTSSPSTTASCRAPTAASSRSTSSPTSPSASRSVCSTCSRSATCRSAATRSASRSTCMLRRVGQPRGLHEPRPHHHAAQGPLRRADPHALPARRRARGRGHRAGGAPARSPSGLNVHVPDVHDRDRRRDEPAGPPVAAHQPALGRVGAALDRQLRDAGRQRDPARAAPRRDRGRAARQRPRRARREHRGQGRVRDASTTAARSRCSTAS